MEIWRFNGSTSRSARTSDGERIQHSRVKVLAVCLRCKRKFSNMHGLRIYCPECHPPTSEKEKQKYADEAKAKQKRSGLVVKLQ